MRTTTTSDTEPTFLSTLFETCAGFAPPADRSPVCTACGWLADEHDHGIAEVRALPSPRREVSRRLAS